MPHPRAFARASLVAALLLGLLAAATVPTLTSVNAAPGHPGPLSAACSDPLAQWTFTADSLTPTAGTGTFAFQPPAVGPPTFPAGQVAGQDPSIGFTNWPLTSPADPLTYIELDVSTTGSKSIQLAFDYQSTNKGPSLLDVSYSTDGGATYIVFAPGVSLASTWTHLSYDFTAIAAINDNPDVRFRLSPYAAGAASGILSLDNITISHSCFTPTPTDTSTPTNTATPGPGSIVISEVRFIGSGGPTDEFVELFNRSCSTTFDLNGWSLKFSDSAGNVSPLPLYQFSATTPLPPGHFFLVSSTGFAPSSQQSVPDVTYDGSTLDIPPDGGVALFLPAPNGSTWIDQVGLSAGSAYKEATPLTTLTTPSDQGYERKSSGLGFQDSNDNSLDFTRLPSDPRNSTQVGSCGVPQTPTPTLTRTATPLPGFHPRLLISEVGYGGTSSDHADQWIELYNPTTQDQLLGGWSLETSSGTVIANLHGTLGPGGFYLLVHGSTDQATQAVVSTPTLPSVSTPPSCLVFYRSDVDVAQVFSTTLSNYGQGIFLINPANGIEDTADRYGYAWPAGSYAPPVSMERSGMITDTTVGAWFTFAGDPVALNTARDCDGNHVYGTPGFANWAFSVTATPSPIPTSTRKPTPRPPTPFAHMVLNEFLPRAGTDWNGDGTIDVYDEFIELKNLGPIDVNLQGWKIDVLASGPSTTFTLPSLTLHTGERVFYYGSQDHLLQPDSGATVRLFNNRGILIDARSYGPVENADVSHCRIPDGYYWQDACFPTPGLENTLTGAAPAPPPIVALKPPPCLLADTVPQPFRDAECFPYGADVFNPAYWDDQAGHALFPVQDLYNKWKTWVQ